MRNWMKWVAPVMGFALMALPLMQSRADDAPAPAVTAKVIVTVLDSNGKPVSGAQVRLVMRARPAKAPSDSGDTGQARPKPTSVAQGQSAADGTVSFPNIAEGHYGVLARARGLGRGMARVSVEGSSDVTVSVTLQAKGSGAGNSPNPPNPPPDSK
jgi:hypothetical protein